MPSLHMDLSRGKGKSEVHVLNGAIAEAGQRLGIPVPANRALFRVLAGITRGALPWDDFRGRPDRLLAEAGLL
jgi:2-dehydropantoate 2-reductase